MAEQIPDSDQIGIGLQKMACEAMAKRVRRRRVGQSEVVSQRLHPLLHLTCGQWRAMRRYKNRTVGRDSVGARSYVCPYSVSDCREEWNNTLVAALPGDAQRYAVLRNVAPSKAQCLRDP